MISKAERITINGFTWYFQTFRTEDGKIEAVTLYASDGDYVTEFKDHEEMIHFLNGVIDCGKGAVILG